MRRSVALYSKCKPIASYIEFEFQTLSLNSQTVYRFVCKQSALVLTETVLQVSSDDGLVKNN